MTESHNQETPVFLRQGISLVWGLPSNRIEGVQEEDALVQLHPEFAKDRVITRRLSVTRVGLEDSGLYTCQVGRGLYLEYIVTSLIYRTCRIEHQLMLVEIRTN